MATVVSKEPVEAGNWYYVSGNENATLVAPTGATTPVTVKVIVKAGVTVTISENVNADVYIGEGTVDKDKKTASCTYDANTRITVTGAASENSVVASADGKYYTTKIASGVITVTEGSTPKVYSALTSAINVSDKASVVVTIQNPW